MSRPLLAVEPDRNKIKYSDIINTLRPDSWQLVSIGSGFEMAMNRGPFY